MMPKDRVNLITTATGDLKRSRAAVAAHSLTQLANWAPATIQGLAGRLMTSQMQWSTQSVVNIVATNMPGAQFPFHKGGAEPLDIWPFDILLLDIWPLDIWPLDIWPLDI